MDGEQQVERTSVVVIGAGQAGLSAGHHLGKRGIPFLVLEANERIGDNWRSRWDTLRLYSPAANDALPGMAFPASRSTYPSGRQMGDYLESYAQNGRLPVRTGVHVDRLRRRDDGQAGFIVDAGDRRYEADQVIVASGPFSDPRIPAFASQLDPAIRQIHSKDYRRPSQLQDGPVLVVGASHSGADLALEAAKAGHPTVLSGSIVGELPVPLESRRARAVFPLLVLVASHVLTLRTPIGRRMAPHVRSGGGPLLRVRRVDLDAAGVERTDERTTSVRDGKPVLADGRVLDVANVLWCTGFRPDYAWIEAPIVADDGWPTQTRGVVESVPGLYFLGLPFLYSFTSMLVAGAGRDAAYVVDRVADRMRVMSDARGRGPATMTKALGG